jgi:hypothetical protein
MEKEDPVPTLNSRIEAKYKNPSTDPGFRVGLNTQLDLELTATIDISEDHMTTAKPISDPFQTAFSRVGMFFPYLPVSASSAILSRLVNISHPLCQSL